MGQVFKARDRNLERVGNPHPFVAFKALNPAFSQDAPKGEHNQPAQRPDGSTANAQLDTNGSSGLPVLDQAAVKCLSTSGSFPAKIVGGRPVGYWARTKFVWSFGG